MVPYLNIQTEDSTRYGLNIYEAAVLAAVQFYCRKAPHSWVKNAEQICRDWPFMPSVTTVKRALKTLAEKEIIIVQRDRIIVPTDRLTVHTDRLTVHTERQILNNINNNSSSCLADEAATLQRKQDLKSLNSSKNEMSNSEIPTWSQVRQYCIERGHNLEAAKSFFAYYTANGWTLKRGAKMQDWTALLCFWMQKEHEKAARFATRAQSGYPETAWGDRQRAMDARMKEEREMIEGFKAREKEQREADKARRAREEASLTDEDILANQQIGLKRKAQMNKDDPRAKMRTNETPHGG